MLQNICQWIQSMDRNSDIMDAYREMTQGELPKEVLTEICTNILRDWKEDVLLEPSQMSPRVKEYYTYLNI